MSLLYLDKLSPEKQQAFKKLKRFSDKFILAGGTAIMLQIGHRLSYDFDCFSQDYLSKTLVRKVRRIFGATLMFDPRSKEQLTFKTGQDTAITFVYHPYKPLTKPLETGYIPLFHLDDLTANKAYTIGRRAAWRDYVDLFFLLKWKLYATDKIVALAKKKFNGEFNEKLFLEQLCYFDDVDILPTVFLKESYTPAQIQAFLQKEVRNYLARILP